jgi:predicted metal-dependent phosphoesterase TrpH
MKRFLADLHIHTCLSPCAELDMTPRRIIAAAVEKGLDIIAISDHNSVENAGIAVRLGKENRIAVLPAMEITSREEAHIIGLFGSVEKAVEMQEIVYRDIPEGFVDSRMHGFQLAVNEKDEILKFSKRIFWGATSLSVKEVVDTVHALGGLAVASHIDREIFSVASQLGFIPRDIDFDAFEISRPAERDKIEPMFAGYGHVPRITSSDAHHLPDIGRKTTAFFLEEPSLEEIALAFKGERRIEW